MKTPVWRLGAAAAVLAALLFFAARLTPVYYRNYQLQRHVENITQNVENFSRPDDLLRTWVVEKAVNLELPVKASNVQIRRSPESLRIDVRYVVRVDLPVYTVDLHFYPGAGAR